MPEQNNRQTDLVVKAQKWAARDPCDPYKQLILDTFLELGGLDAEIALLLEMKRNP